MFEIKPVSIPALLVTLAVGGIGALIAGYEVWGIILLAIAASLALWIMLSLWHRYVPSVFLNEADVRKAFSSIYAKASEDGGLLMATHVVPLAATEDADAALIPIQNAKRPLEWERLVFMENTVAEQQWIANMLAVANPNVTCRVHYIPRNLLVPSVVWQVIPRANILLHNCGNYYESLVGLGTLSSDEFRRPIQISIGV
jgi:TM2 domain-containing membrane protein YozV